MVILFSPGVRKVMLVRDVSSRKPPFIQHWRKVSHNFNRGVYSRGVCRPPLNVPLARANTRWVWVISPPPPCWNPVFALGPWSSSKKHVSYLTLFSKTQLLCCKFYDMFVVAIGQKIQVLVIEKWYLRQSNFFSWTF